MAKRNNLIPMEEEAVKTIGLVKKAVIPVAGSGTRFLPLSKAIPKELWPVLDEPMIRYSVEEAKAAGIKEIIFVLSSGKKSVLDYFKESPKLEKALKENKKSEELEKLKSFSESFRDITFNYVFQKKPLGDGHAVLQAEPMVAGEPFVLFYPDDIIEAKTSATEQLLKTFKTCQKTVIALKRVPKERVVFYGTAAVEKIANRLYKIKKITEKPKPEEAPSDLVYVGRAVITPDTFGYLKRSGLVKGEIRMTGAWNEMLGDGKTIYGYEFDGQWLECGNKLAWLKSFFYLALKDKRFGPELKKYLKDIKAD